MESEATTEELRQKAWSKLSEQRFVQLTTSDGRGQLVGRPMTLQQSDDGHLWFFASRSSNVAEAVQRDPRVNVCCMDPQDNFYLSISGTAQLVDDAERKLEMWSPVVRAWFPQGVNDPDLVLVRVGITHAEVWNSDDNRMQKFFSVAKAALTGAPMRSAGDHAVVRM